MNRAHNGRRRAGRVYLVGAGPGDPRLLTLRAASLLRRADVVLHDSLVGDRILRLVRTGAECIDVGKRCGGPRTDQALINRMLVDAARRVRRVVRLKGGDPLIFGRGGEEAEAVRAAGLRCEIVPGITAALGVAAYAGIPLTQRGISSTLTFVTGRESTLAGAACVDWERHGGSHETLVVYMGTTVLHELAERLVRAGRCATTPVAVIARGTLPQQRTIVAPLARIAAEAAAAGVAGPALIVVGEAVPLRRNIEWFERRRLHGVRVLVARSRPQPSRLARRLRALGADVLEAPRFDVLPPADGAPLIRALERIDHYRWLAFADASAVHACWQALHQAGRDTRAFAGSRFAAFGGSAAVALAEHGVRADVKAPGYAPARVTEHFPAQAAGGCCPVLFPRAAGLASPLAAALRDTGRPVHEVVAYRASPSASAAASVRDQLAAGAFAVVVFASSNSVRVFHEQFGAVAPPVRIAAIGPATAHMAATLGLAPHAVADEPTFAQLIRIIR